MTTGRVEGDLIRPGGRRLGELLVHAQVLREAQLVDALRRQQGSGKRLGAVLVEMGLLDERLLVAALGTQFGLPVADVRHCVPEPEALAGVPEDRARSLTVLPLRRRPEGLEVAVAEPPDPAARARLEEAAGGPVSVVLAAGGDVRTAIERSYRA